MKTISSYAIHSVKNKNKKVFTTDTAANALQIATSELLEGKRLKFARNIRKNNLRGPKQQV